MKITLTLALLLAIGFLFAQTDAAEKNTPVKVLENGKIAVKPIPLNDSNKIVKLLDSANKAITVAKDYPIYHTNMTFWEKCKYWFFFIKREQPLVFWPLLFIVGIWLLRLISKLFSR